MIGTARWDAGGAACNASGVQRRPATVWKDRYKGDQPLPWDTGRVDQHLVTTLDAHGITGGKGLEIGCGTGTNSVWLAERGFEVTAVDVAAEAIEAARAKARARGVAERCSFFVLDFLEQAPEGAPFDLVFDRGVLHVFDEAADQARFAERIAAVLGEDGLWLSVIGSTEGPERDHGPPRRSMRDIANAIEPHLEIISLRGAQLDANTPTPPRAWVCLSRRRTVPAVPSTRRG